MWKSESQSNSKHLGVALAITDKACLQDDSIIECECTASSLYSDCGSLSESYQVETQKNWRKEGKIIPPEKYTGGTSTKWTK